MAAFLLLFFPIDDTLFIKRTIEFPCSPNEVSLGMKIKCVFQTKALNDSGRESESQEEREGFVVFHSARKKTCIDIQEKYEKLVAATPKLRRLQILVAEGEKDMRDADKCTKRGAPQKSIQENINENNQTVTKGLKRKQEAMLEESSKQIKTGLERTVAVKEKEKLEDSQQIPTQELSDQEIMYMAMLRGFVRKNKTVELKCQQILSPCTSPNHVQSVCIRDTNLPPSFIKQEQDLPQEHTVFSSSTRPDSPLSPGESDNIRGLTPLPIFIKQEEYLPSPCQSDSIRGLTSPPMLSFNEEDLQGRQPDLDVYQPCIETSHQLSFTEQGLFNPTESEASSATSNDLHNAGTSSASESVGDSMNIILNDAASNILVSLQEENQRLRDENAALIRENALRKTGSVTGITWQHINTLRELTGILEWHTQPSPDSEGELPSTPVRNYNQDSGYLSTERECNPVQHSIPLSVRNNANRILPDPTSLSVRDNTGRTLPEPTPLSVRDNTGRTLPEPTPLSVRDNTGRTLPEPTPLSFRDNTGRTLPEPTPLLVRDNTGRPLPEPTSLSVRDNTGRTLPDPTSLSVRDNTGRTLPDPTSLSVRDNTGRTLPEPTPLSVRDNTGRTLPEPMSLSVRDNTGRTLPEPMSLSVGNSSNRTLPEPTPLSVGDDIGRTLPKSTPYSIRKNVGRTLPETTLLSVGNSANRTLRDPLSISVGNSANRTLPEPTPLSVGDDIGRTLPESTPYSIRKNVGRTLPEPMSLSVRNSANRTLPEPTPLFIRKNVVRTMPEPMSLSAGNSANKTLPEPMSLSVRKSANRTLPEPTPLFIRKNVGRTNLEPMSLSAGNSANRTLPEPQPLHVSSCSHNRFSLQAAVSDQSESYKRVLVTVKENPDQFADVKVPTLALFKAEMAALKSKDYFGTLLNELIDILFTKQELRISGGLGLRKNKDTKDRLPLDKHRVDALRVYLQAKAEEQNIAMTLSKKSFNVKFQNKIGNAKRTFFNKIKL
ncbi:uncharacterized protein LOC102807301 [Saccoglossus kowalevskii]